MPLQPRVSRFHILVSDLQRFLPQPGPASGFSIGLHPRSKFLAAMKISSSFLTLSVATLIAATAQAVSTGEPFYGDAPDATHPWCVHDWNRPQPPRVEPKSLVDAKPPADAVVLFDGTEASLANWEADKPQSEPTKWVVKDGALLCVPNSGYVRTKSKFGDCQLHVEWSAPTPPQG